MVMAKKGNKSDLNQTTPQLKVVINNYSIGASLARQQMAMIEELVSFCGLRELHHFTPMRFKA